MPPPSDPREPGTRGDDWRPDQGGRSDVAPTREPARRRPRIDSRNGTEMFPEVLEYVHERVPNFPRCAERMCVIAAVPHAPASPDDAVDRARYADGEPLRAAREPRRRVRLHEQVQMIALNTVV
jgi:hypothetical protein